MFDISDLEAPIWGDKESGTAFVVSALERWTNALTSYTGKSDKPTAKVEKVLASLQENEELVAGVDNAMREIRSFILDVVDQLGPESTYLLFSELDDVKKAVGSWRSDANVTVENDNGDEEERDIIAEYEALEKGKTMIEGTFNAFGLDVMALPEKFRAQKSENVNGKRVKTNEWYLKFPGKLVTPVNEETVSSPGKTATSMTYQWTLTDSLGEQEIGRATFPYLARFCSTDASILSTTDLLNSMKAKYGDNFAGEENLEIRTPRGILRGKKVKK